MGLGKTFIGAHKLISFKTPYNLLICQKSKIKDWITHFKTHYPDMPVSNYTKPKSQISEGLNVINYDLAWRRPELLNLKNYTLMLDESSEVQNENNKRTKFILKLQPDNVILLSGTPTSGKYERLWSQAQLLGWNISKKLYWEQYVITETRNYDGTFFKVVVGYKNVDRLIAKFKEHGAVFMKADENVPEVNEIPIVIDHTKEYRKFKKDKLITINDTTLVGDTSLKKMLYQRQLCGQYNKFKLQALKDLINSTDNRLIIFYNFNGELDAIREIVTATERPISIVNGKTQSLDAYEQYDNSITLIQYQAGAMGLNLQKANKIIYFTPPNQSLLFEQSKARIKRIGQMRPCFYYYLTVKNSVEEQIYKTLKQHRDFTDRLFNQLERDYVA